MKLTENMKDYEPLVVPLDKPIENLTPKEAKMYFNWFVAHIDERSDYLRGKVSSKFGVSIEQLDLSPESLKLVWKWFLEVATISKTPWNRLKQLKRELTSQSLSIKNDIMKDSGEELSLFTRYVLRDIGMYIGKVFTIYNPVIVWTFKTTPKNYISVNEPILIGFIDDNPDYPKPFYPDLDPIALAEVCALNILDKTQQEDDLYNACMKWIQWIPSEK